MYKLYYGTGSCSLAPHITLNMAGADFNLERVDLKEHKLAEAGTDFYAINAKGYVPALKLQDGSLLTEGVAIMQYVADTFPQAGLVPANGSMERYRLQEWLNFITSELHKGIGAFFSPLMVGDFADAAREKAKKRLQYVEDKLAETGTTYLMGNTPTVADNYLFTVLRWLPAAKIELSAYPKLTAFMQAMNTQPAVQKALAAEGLTA